ncbi:universal stress protein [Paenibacillus zeisoli]|uniref:Universal stress protein n=1 Tax=Paenibacillus zeisoli TaxID=2496267 RepID=A0A3S1D719_9BACL|nr:universal stress protein [Paenibacillus zeisoli]RUT28105.1 universal stress protein [Paenibacillus zeisoli]
MFNHILIPIDGSTHAMRALETAKSFVQSLSLSPIELTVLHVNPELSYNEPPLGVDVEARLEEEGRQIVEPAVQLFAGLPVQCLVMTKHGDPASLICAAAEEVGADIIIMGTRGMNLVSEILLGSVSHHVIQHAPCPVMTVK